ncbi:MAG: hypothetical protein JSU00_23665 [Acidobacteria bacterium]|nr:hypothetical protein [Acidobacteriota bacterium]
MKRIVEIVGHARRHTFSAGWWTHLGAPALLALNAWIAWRLFRLSYPIQMGSVSGAFVSLARYLRDHWREADWWPIWHCGMPFENTYAPLLHALVATVSGVSSLEIGRAYHLTLALVYVITPVTVFLLAWRLTGKRAVALAAGLTYSLISPSALIFPAIGRDLGGPFFARRLQALLVYGDSPHALALLLIPVVLLLVDRARARRTIAAFIFASAATGALMLSNIPGAIALGMALIAYCAAYGGFALVSGICVGGYLLTARWNPPSTLLNTFSNTQWMEPASRFDENRLAMLAALGAAVAITAWGLRRLSVRRSVAWAVLFTLVTGAVVCGNAWFGVTFIAQPMRFHLVFEMALTLAVALGLGEYVRLSRKAAIVAMLAMAPLIALQIHNYRTSARRLIQPISIRQTSEYRVAAWLEAHAGGQRVLAPGSIAFWLNAFTDTPQVTGCCDQSILVRPIKMAYYVIGSDDGAGDRAAEISIAWLQALGARYVVMTGPGSTETFHDIAHPDKFRGKLREAWSGGGDAIYEVPQRTGSLVHVIRLDETVQTPPENGVKIEPLMAYIRATQDSSRELAEVRWTSPGRAHIAANLTKGDALSVQTAWHPRWRATVNGANRHVDHDGLGFIVIHPDCEGRCEVELSFDGGVERTTTNTVTAASWIVVALLLMRRLRRGRGTRL